MIISYLGNHYLKIQQGDTILSINPVSKDAKVPYKPARFGADIILSSVNQALYNGFDQNKYNENNPLIINGPGDYESKEIFIKGVGSKKTIDKKEYINTSYSIVMEGITMTVLGPLSETLKVSDREGLGSPEILFVSLREEGLSISELYKIAISFEPNIIIPVEYTEKTLEFFLKEAGNKSPEKVDKLTLKKKDILSKLSEIILIDPSN